MKYILSVLSFLMSGVVYGQYRHDYTIRQDPFFKTVDSSPEKQCGIDYIYYEQEDGYGINDARMKCYLLQEQIKDSLRAKFNDKELFEIAQYSKIAFYRIAAFELYAQTDYSTEEVIRFLKRGKIPSYLSNHTASDTIPETYIPMPNSLLPEQAAIRFKMLEIINPVAVRRTRKDTLDGYTMIYVPRYPKSKRLDLEHFISVQTYLRYYCQEHFGYYSVSFVRLLKPGEKKPKTPTFNIPDPVVDFGTIDLNYSDSAKTYFELRGAIKVINNTSKAITIQGQASAHTMCLKDKYVIPAKQEMMIEFKSLVELHKPLIDRTITLRNVETGGVQVFKFKANFIHPKSHPQ